MREALAVKKVKPSDVRGELGLTIRELEILSGVSAGTIVKAEAGGSIRRLTAHKLFNAMNKERVAQKLRRLEFDAVDWNIQGND